MTLQWIDAPAHIGLVCASAQGETGVVVLIVPDDSSHRQSRRHSGVVLADSIPERAVACDHLVPATKQVTSRFDVQDV